MVDHRTKRHTHRCWEEGEAHAGRQGGENRLAIDLLAEARRHFDFDASSSISGIPVALRDGGLVKGRPLQVMDDGMTTWFDACSFGCSMSVNLHILRRTQLVSSRQLTNDLRPGAIVRVELCSVRSCQQVHHPNTESSQSTHAVVRPSTMILICQSALSPKPGMAIKPTCTGCVHECKEMLKCLPPGILGTKQVRSGVGAAPASGHQYHLIEVWINPRNSIRRREHTIGACGPAAIASLYGVARGLELLERHLAALGVEDDVPVLIAHGG
jgi:hypothetical protein